MGLYSPDIILVKHKIQKFGKWGQELQYGRANTFKKFGQARNYLFKGIDLMSGSDSTFRQNPNFFSTAEMV